MMGREDARNMMNFMTEEIWIISESGWLFKRKSITMHGNMNVQLLQYLSLPPCPTLSPSTSKAIFLTESPSSI